MGKEKFNKQIYDNEYIKNNKDRINFVMPKGRKEEIKEAAAVQGISASEWINGAIEAKLVGELEEIRAAQKESDSTIDLKEIPELSIYARNYPGGAISDKEWITKAIERMKEWQDQIDIEEIQRESI